MIDSFDKKDLPMQRIRLDVESRRTSVAITLFVLVVIVFLCALHSAFLSFNKKSQMDVIDVDPYRTLLYCTLHTVRMYCSLRTIPRVINRGRNPTSM